jgi:outer membrane protein OmpA-like peptidoglycan-associated protein
MNEGRSANRHRPAAWAAIGLVAVSAAATLQAAAAATPAARELDRAGAALRVTLKNTDITLEKIDGQFVMRIPAASMFDADSDALRPGTANFRPLADLAKVLKRYRDVAADIRVYTDVIGGASANQALSEGRAQAIATALEQIGATASQVMPHGFGATQPVAPNDSAEGRRANRRVEIWLASGGSGTSGGSRQVLP